MEIGVRIRRLTDSVASKGQPVGEERRQILRELKELNPDDRSRVLELAYLELELGSAAQAQDCLRMLEERDPLWPPLTRLRQALMETQSVQND